MGKKQTREDLEKRLSVVCKRKIMHSSELEKDHMEEEQIRNQLKNLPSGHEICRLFRISDNENGSRAIYLYNQIDPKGKRQSRTTSSKDYRNNDIAERIVNHVNAVLQEKAPQVVQQLFTYILEEEGREAADDLCEKLMDLSSRKKESEKFRKIS